MSWERSVVIKSVWTVREPPSLSGGLPFLGHAVGFSRNPVRFLVGARQRLGDVFTTRLFGRKLTVVCGPEASDAVFRADDSAMGRARAYRSMIPVFGEGILFDAPEGKSSTSTFPSSCRPCG